MLIVLLKASDMFDERVGNSVLSNQVIDALGIFDWLIDVSSLIDLLDWPEGLDWLLFAN
jgi:hypothetical protein